MFTESYSIFLSQLKEGRISHTEFLTLAGHDEQYRKWCEEHHLKPSEDNAELFFSMHGYEESETVKEFIEAV